MYVSVMCLNRAFAKLQLTVQISHPCKIVLKKSLYKNRHILAPSELRGLYSSKQPLNRLSYPTSRRRC